MLMTTEIDGGELARSAASKATSARVNRPAQIMRVPGSSNRQPDACSQHQSDACPRLVHGSRLGSRVPSTKLVHVLTAALHPFPHHKSEEKRYSERAA